MQGFTYSDLQALMNSSEARYTAGLVLMRDSLTEISVKIDRALEHGARDDVRIRHLEERVAELEESSPDNNAVTRAVKWIGTAIFAAVIGAAANNVDKLLAPSKPTATTVQSTPATAPK